MRSAAPARIADTRQVDRIHPVVCFLSGWSVFVSCTVRRALTGRVCPQLGEVGGHCRLVRLHSQHEPAGAAGGHRQTRPDRPHPLDDGSQQTQRRQVAAYLELGHPRLAQTGPQPARQHRHGDVVSAQPAERALRRLGAQNTDTRHTTSQSRPPPDPAQCRNGGHRTATINNSRVPEARH